VIAARQQPIVAIEMIKGGATALQIIRNGYGEGREEGADANA
jgi:hypothetical protein